MHPAIGLCFVGENEITMCTSKEYQEERLRACGIIGSGAGSTTTDALDRLPAAPEPSEKNKKSFQKYSGMKIFNGSTTQETVFDTMGKPILEDVKEGRNGGVIAYGQTGSGKTHSMMGSPSQPGICPRLIDALLAMGCKLSLQVVEVYGNECFDLLEFLQKKDQRMAAKGPKATEKEL
jgi:Kinesin motor domain